MRGESREPRKRREPLSSVVGVLGEPPGRETGRVRIQVRPNAAGTPLTRRIIGGYGRRWFEAGVGRGGRGVGAWRACSRGVESSLSRRVVPVKGDCSSKGDNASRKEAGSLRERVNRSPGGA